MARSKQDFAKEFERVAKAIPGIGRDPASVRQRIEAMEHLLEGLFTVPGINRKIGLDVILDILPFGGPTIATIMGAWIVWEARNLNVPGHMLVRMAGNVGLDALLSAIPFLGAVPDFFFRSNTRNVKMLRKWLDRHHPGTAIIQG